jgi:tetratricopeptide (TPR) repeat protein
MHLIRARSIVVAGLLVGTLSGGASAQTAADSYYNFLIGRQLESDGNVAAALTALERAAAGDPRSAEIRAEIASMHQAHNQPEQAEKAAKAALALDAGNLLANKVLGLLNASAAQRDRNSPAQTMAYVRDAVKYLERAVSGAQGPADPNLNYTLGSMYLMVDEPAKAIQALSRVVDQNPFSAQARQTLARAYAAAGDLNSAIQTIEDVVEEEPRLLRVLAAYQHQAGKLTEAIATYSKALEGEPSNKDIKRNRILALYEAEQYDRAAQFAEDARRQHPDDPRFPPLLADSISKTGNTARAIEILESAIRTFAADANTHLALAGMYSDVGRGADAEKSARQALAVEPTNPRVLNYLGYMLAQNGKNLDEAIQLVNRALQAAPGEGAYLDSLGWAHFRRGDLNEAEKYIGAAAAKMPDNAEVLDHLGDLHARLGRWQDAIAAWTRALKGQGGGIEPATVQKKIDDARVKASR